MAAFPGWLTHVSIALSAHIEFIFSPPELVLNAKSFFACLTWPDVQVSEAAIITRDEIAVALFVQWVKKKYNTKLQRTVTFLHTTTVTERRQKADPYFCE